MKWYLKCFIATLLLCCTAQISAVQSEPSMPLIVSDLNFSQRADGACYQPGSNKLSVEMYNQESKGREALLLFAVKHADTGALLSVGSQTDSILTNPIVTNHELLFTIPADIDIAKTRGTLLVLDANTMQPLAAAHTIDPRQSYPYIPTPQKTHLLQTLSGAVAKSGENAVTLQTTNDTITLPVAPEVAALLPSYEGKPCDCFIDIDTKGQRTISAISLQTITIHCQAIDDVYETAVTYYDTKGQRHAAQFDQTLTVYRHGLSITDISKLSSIIKPNVADDYITFVDTDGNGQVNLINIHRTDHAAVVGIDGTIAKTANMGNLDLSQTILIDKTGAAVPLSQLHAGDVLAITWHPGQNHTPYQAIVLPASYVDGTVTSIDTLLNYLDIDDVTYSYWMPNNSYPYPLPSIISITGRFYLDRYGNIFAAYLQDSPQPYDFLESVGGQEELFIQTTYHGSYHLSKTDTLLLQDNTGKTTAVTPMDTLSADDFSGTTFEQLFDGQETLPVYELLGNLPILTETVTADDLFTHAVGAAYDYTTNRLTLSPLPINEKTVLQDVVFTKADMTITGDASYPLAPDALMMQAVFRSKDLYFTKTSAEQIPDGAYDMLLYGKNDTGRYRAAIFIQYTQSFQWQQAQPAIIEQITQNPNDTLRVSVYTQSGRKEIQFTNDSCSADIGRLDNLAIGDVIVYLSSDDTVQQYLKLGRAYPAFPLQFAPTNVLDKMGIPGARCIYGYAAKNDGETLTITSLNENISIAIPADFTVMHADYTTLPQNDWTVSPITIDSVIPLNATMSSESPSATPVMAFLRDDTLVDLIAFSPMQTFSAAQVTHPMSVITRVSKTFDQSGNPVLRVYAVQNSSSNEISYYLSSDSINADTGKATAMTDSFRQGTVALFFADSQDNVFQYHIVGSPVKDSNVPFVLEPAFATESTDRYSDEYRLGYIQEIYGSRIDLCFPNTTQWKEETYRLYGANEYCYNDINANNIRIEVGGYESGDVDEPYDGKCSYVLVHLRDDEIVDIYSFNQRYPIPEA